MCKIIIEFIGTEKGKAVIVTIKGKGITPIVNEPTNTSMYDAANGYAYSTGGLFTPKNIIIGGSLLLIAIVINNNKR